jgi:hypothetical protein
LCEIGDEDVCEALLLNEGARILPASLHRIAERQGRHAAIRKLLGKRDDLAPCTRLVLIDHLGEALRADHARDGDLPAARIETMVRDQCDKAIIAFAANAGEEDLPGIVEALVESGKITSAFLLRAICLGNISLFAQSLSAIAEVPPERVEAVLSENRRSAFRAMYAKAGMPQSAFEVFASAIDGWRRHLVSADPVNRDRLPYLVTRELLATYHPGSGGEVDDLLVLLRKLSAEAARENARSEARRIASEAHERTQMLLQAPKAISPEEAYPVIDIDEEALIAFAGHFAEEIVDMEEEMARVGAEIVANAETPDQDLAQVPQVEPDSTASADEAATGDAANDDAPPVSITPSLLLDLGDVARVRAAA